MEKLREPGLELPGEFAAFPVALPNEAAIWGFRGIAIVDLSHCPGG